MLNIITGRISAKVSFLVNTLILIIMAAGCYYLILEQSRSLEAELLNRGRMQSITGAKMIGKLLDEAIDNGVFAVKDAFDTDYQQIGNFDPPKYHTRYDAYTDKAFLAIIDEFLLDKSVVFAVPVDVNGYLPTHNTRYQQPITGDPDKDRIGNRTKRVFNDPVGIKAARNTDRGFQQIYYRDTGEVMWDISSPIFVKGKHWGGFRIGFSLESINTAKQNLMIKLIIIMAVIILVSTIMVFLTVRWALAPLKRLTVTAMNLANGKNLEQEIVVTKHDEIGAMQEVLERLRLSMILALKRRKK